MIMNTLNATNGSQLPPLLAVWHLDCPVCICLRVLWLISFRWNVDVLVRVAIRQGPAIHCLTEPNNNFIRRDLGTLDRADGLDNGGRDLFPDSSLVYKKSCTCSIQDSMHRRTAELQACV